MDPLRMGDLPPEFDIKVYQTRNPDLAGLSPARARAHYANFGCDEGRVCCSIDGRGPLLGLIPQGTSILEIGPFCTPAFPAGRPGVRFLDIMTTNELRARATRYEWAKPELVPPIDYVWRGERYADLIDRRFEVVFSSHSIQHQPCLVSHLRDVAAILADGGRMFLIVPDMRFTFDYYVPQSTLADVAEALRQARTRPPPRAIYAEAFLHTHNIAQAHWAGDHGPDPRSDPSGRGVETLRALESEAPPSEHVDCHCWTFTPASFRGIVEAIGAAGLIQLKFERLYSTLRQSNEFFAVLRKDGLGH